jgi:hypothetical protein
VFITTAMGYARSLMTRVVPECCSQFKAEFEFCGNSREEALLLLTDLEAMSDPQGDKRD